MFADHIGNLTVELVLASAEVKHSHFFSSAFCLNFCFVYKVTTLVRRRHPSLNTLNLLLEAQPFPGLEPESKISHHLLNYLILFILLRFLCKTEKIHK